jgi:hypothetical protein
MITKIKKQTKLRLHGKLKGIGVLSISDAALKYLIKKYAFSKSSNCVILENNMGSKVNYWLGGITDNETGVLFLKFTLITIMHIR